MDVNVNIKYECDIGKTYGRCVRNIILKSYSILEFFKNFQRYIWNRKIQRKSIGVVVNGTTIFVYSIQLKTKLMKLVMSAEKL